MKYYDPITIKPLTLRGVMGISRAIAGKPAAPFGYVLLMTFIQIVITAAFFTLPVLIAVNAGTVGGIALGVLALLLYIGFLTLLFNPVFSSTLYYACSDRIRGNASNAFRMLGSIGSMLKQFFTTALCVLLCNVIVNTVMSSVSSIATLGAGAVSLAKILPFGGLTSFMFDPFGTAWNITLGVIVGAVAAFVLSIAISVLAQSFLAFIYPVAINEDKLNFAAVGRSITLAAKHLGRVFSAKLIATLIYFAAILFIVAIGGFLYAIFGESLMSLWGIVTGSVLLLAAILISAYYSAYVPALDTVLYFDSRVRDEGDGFMHAASGDANADATVEECVDTAPCCGETEGTFPETEEEEQTEENCDTDAEAAALPSEIYAASETEAVPDGDGTAAAVTDTESVQAEDKPEIPENEAQ